MDKQILVEQMTSEETNLIQEAVSNETGKPKKMYLKGTFMQAENYNRNKRKYPLNEIVNAVATINRHIKEMGGSVGESRHPEARLHVLEEEISHMVTEIHMDGNSAKGTILMLDTPKGLILQTLYNAGLRPACSSRGSGTVMEGNIVQDFEITALDLVLTPSCAAATPDLVFESKQFSKVHELAKSVKDDPAAQKYFKKEINKFLSEFFKK